jgi:hypothetical protein
VSRRAIRPTELRETLSTDRSTARASVELRLGPDTYR